MHEAARFPSKRTHQARCNTSKKIQQIYSFPSFAASLHESPSLQEINCIDSIANYEPVHKISIRLPSSIQSSTFEEPQLESQVYLREAQSREGESLRTDSMQMESQGTEQESIDCQALKERRIQVPHIQSQWSKENELPTISFSLNRPTESFAQSECNEQTKEQMNIKVFCRFRPTFKTPASLKYDSTMIEDGENSYSFDHIFGKYSAQQEVYEKVGKRHVEQFLKGKNSTVFAYGQTGSGKTYTMFGDMRDSTEFGIIPRALEDIFNHQDAGSPSPSLQTIPSSQSITSPSSSSLPSPPSMASLGQFRQPHTITCSMLQIYNERLIDLFNPSIGNYSDVKLKEYHDSICLQGLIQVSVQSKQELLSLIKLGHRGRKTGMTQTNDCSSRSHTVLFVYRSYSCGGQTYKCKLCFIDLAGSEKIQKSGVKGQALQQTKKINLSLSCLGNVVHALTNCADHIPYRNSKLTRLLKDSLSGDTKTSIITTCSLDKSDQNESISTIKFAVRAKKIKNKQKLNSQQVTMEQLVSILRQELAETKKELEWYKLKEESGDIPEQSVPYLPVPSTLACGAGLSGRGKKDNRQNDSRDIKTGRDINVGRDDLLASQCQ